MPRAAAIAAEIPGCGADPVARTARSINRAFDAIGNSLREGVRRTAKDTASAIFPAARHPRRNLNASDSSLPDAGRTPANATDEALFVRHREGDPNALRELMTRYSGELHGFLTRLLGSRTAADDVFQEAFLQVHLSAESFDSDRRFRPWLYTIAANKGRDYLRRNRRRTAISLDAPLSASSNATLVDLLALPGDSPSEPLEASDERNLVKQVVDELPPHFREILLLSYFQKLSYAQISDSLQIPLGTVKSRLHAAVASFAHSWKLACARRGLTTDTDTDSPDDER